MPSLLDNLPNFMKVNQEINDHNVFGYAQILNLLFILNMMFLCLSVFLLFLEKFKLEPHVG